MDAQQAAYVVQSLNHIADAQVAQWQIVDLLGYLARIAEALEALAGQAER